MVTGSLDSPPPPPRPPRPGAVLLLWGCAFLLMLAVQVGIPLGVALRRWWQLGGPALSLEEALALADERLLMEQLPLMILSSQLVAFVLPLALVFGLGRRRPGPVLGLDRWVPAAFGPTVLAVVGLFLVNAWLGAVLARLLPGSPADTVILRWALETTAIRGWGPVLGLLALLPGLCEEAFFRGYMQARLTAAWGAAGAVLVTAFCFAAMHLSLLHFLPLFLFGLLLGGVRAATGSPYPCLFAHMANNPFALLLSAPGAAPPEALLRGMALIGGGALVLGLLGLRAAGRGTDRV